MLIPNLEIGRVEEDFENGTFGYLKLQKKIFCVTLEPADLENVQDVSSIPAQQYDCKRVISPTFGETFEILNVPGRTDVLFHWGNWIKNTLGCILLAQYWGKVGSQKGIANSGNTFKRFMTALEGYDRLHLTITEHY